MPIVNYIGYFEYLSRLLSVAGGIYYFTDR